MSEFDIVILPTLYVCALVTGFLMNTCSKSKIMQKLEDENCELEWENSILIHKLEEAEKTLRSVTEKLSAFTDS
jgi:hypothetical protein